MFLREVFESAIGGDWITSGYDVQYRIEEDGELAHIYFQGSVSKEDWKLDFDFIAIPYKRMEPSKKWYVHKGFITGYKSVRDEILARIKNKKLITISGYSLGGAYATLCHEDIKFHYPSMDISTITYGCPKVFWMPPKFIKERCDDILHVRNYGDIVPSLPAWLMGFRHVGYGRNIGSLAYMLKHSLPIKRWDELPGAKMHLVGSYRGVFEEMDRRLCAK